MSERNFSKDAALIRTAGVPPPYQQLGVVDSALVSGRRARVDTLTTWGFPPSEPRPPQPTRAHDTPTGARDFHSSYRSQGYRPHLCRTLSLYETERKPVPGAQFGFAKDSHRAQSGGYGRRVVDAPLRHDRSSYYTGRVGDSYCASSSTPSLSFHAPLRESDVHNVQPLMPKSSQQQKVHTTETARVQDAAEILLGLREKLTQKQTKKSGAKQEHQPPQIQDPHALPTRLALPEDDSKLNSMHCYLRSHLIEVFVVERSKTAATPVETSSVGHNLSGRVGLRCVFCGEARKRKTSSSDGEAPMAVFYPKSISELYRLVTSWQRVHLRKCKNLPPSVRETYMGLKETDKTRGKTHYWITSAHKIGLIDCTSKAGGIRFCVRCVGEDS